MFEELSLKHPANMLSEITDLQKVEISGEALKSFINGFPDYLTDIAFSTLNSHNIDLPEPGHWYNFNNYLNVLNEIGAKFGADTLYAIGKQSLNCAIVPKNIKSLKDAIGKLENAFTLNHRNSQICKVTLEDYNIKGLRVILIMENPYPYEINRGIITCMAREFNPIKDKIPEVTIDVQHSMLNKGRYIITW